MYALYLLSEGAGEGPNSTLSWIFYIGLGLFFLLILVGWLVSSMKQSQPEVQNEAQKSKAKK